MPRACGVVAEFNPFHNAHRALLRAAKNEGAESVVAVMSGNFVQRGSPAVTDKRVRVHAALLNGADLVIELPVAAATATAQRFARAAVYLLYETGCVDMLAFGSECGDLNALNTLAKAVDEPAVTSVMRRLLQDGVTFAKARELAVAEIHGEALSALLSAPNNALGVEYLREAIRMGFPFSAFTMKRVGTGHHDEAAAGGYASASFLRANADDFALLARCVPESAAGVYTKAVADGLYPAAPEKLETAMLAHLRRLDISDLRRLPDLSEGLENRLYACIRQAQALKSLENALKTKRYTMARVRRLVLSAFLGLTKADQTALPPYIRVLGFNENGRELLSEMKRSARLPLDTSLARLRGLNANCARFANLESLATDLYGLCLPSPLPCGYEYTAKGVFI